MAFNVASEKSSKFPSSTGSDNGPENIIVKPTVTMQPAEAPTRPSPDSLTTLPEILSSLSLLESEEADLSSNLQELLANRDPVVSSLSRLHNLLPQLDELRTDAYVLTRKVSVTAETADRIGGSVRALDEEMRRVREASDRVAQVMDLKVYLPSSDAIVMQRIFTAHVVIARCPPICYRLSGLGVCYAPLLAGYGSAVGSDRWRVRSSHRRAYISLQ
jgi:hypothetical protein